MMKSLPIRMMSGSKYPSCMMLFKFTAISAGNKSNGDGLALLMGLWLIFRLFRDVMLLFNELTKPVFGVVCVKS